MYFVFRQLLLFFSGWSLMVVKENLLHLKLYQSLKKIKTENEREQRDSLKRDGRFQSAMRMREKEREEGDKVEREVNGRK